MLTPSTWSAHAKAFAMLSASFLLLPLLDRLFHWLFPSIPNWQADAVAIGVWLVCAGVLAWLIMRLFAPEVRYEKIARRVLEASRDGIVVVDVTGKIIEWNVGIEQLTGISRAQAFHQPIWKILKLLIQLKRDASTIASGHREKIFEYLQRNQTTPTEMEWETHIRRSDHVELDLQIKVFSISTESGNFTGAIARNVTDRKQHERELATVADVSAALRNANNRAEMFPILLERVTDRLKCNGASIVLRDSATAALIIEASAAEWSFLQGQTLPEGKSLSFEVVATGQPYFQADVRSNSSMDARFMQPGIVALLGIPLKTATQTIGVLWAGRREPFGLFDQQLLTAIADIAANAIQRTTLYEQTLRDAALLTRAYDATIEGWSHALDLRDHETEGHTTRVTKLALQLAEALLVRGEALVNFRRGALLHDIGKMAIPDAILLKPGPLTPEEWSSMLMHPARAYNLLSPIEYLRPALDIPNCHHERWDGTGYPRGLKGEEIPLHARIFALADVWDALTSDRPYRSAWDAVRARAHIFEQAGKHFDPAIVPVFLDLLDQPG